jgi:hypothetical protein
LIRLTNPALAMRKTVARLALVCCLCAVAVFGVPKEAARADWMNLTGAETAPNIAEITVLKDRVRIALEIYVGDLGTFEALLPEDWLKKPARLPLDARLQEFSSKTFQVIADGGVELQAVLNRAEPRLRKDRYSPFAGMVNPTTRQRAPEPPADKRVLYVELDYPFSGRPASLTFVPPLGAGGVPAVTMGFIAYHMSVPVIDFRYLSGPVTLDLDWSDPWYSKFDNPNLKRHHATAMMTFLYVEPREVRHEVLVRARDLLQWTDLGLVDREKIEPGERADLKRRVSAFMRQRNPVSIDGAAAVPVSATVEFLKITTSGLQLSDDQERLDASSALLGVILSYPVAALPERVSMEWELFPSRIKRIPATSIDQAGPFVSFVEMSDPQLIWQNHLLKYQDPQVRPVTRQIGIAAAVAMVALGLTFLAGVAGALFWRFGRGSEFRRRYAVIAARRCWRRRCSRCRWQRLICCPTESNPRGRDRPRRPGQHQSCSSRAHACWSDESAEYGCGAGIADRRRSRAAARSDHANSRRRPRPHRGNRGS